MKFASGVDLQLRALLGRLVVGRSQLRFKRGSNPLHACIAFVVNLECSAPSVGNSGSFLSVSAGSLILPLLTTDVPGQETFAWPG